MTQIRQNFTSRKLIYNDIKGGNLHSFNLMLDSLFVVQGWFSPIERLEDIENPPSLNDLNVLTLDSMEKHINQSTSANRYHRIMREVLNIWKQNKSYGFGDLLNKIMDPKVNGFQKMDVKELQSKMVSNDIDNERELWAEGQFLILDIDGLIERKLAPNMSTDGIQELINNLKG